MARFFVEGVRGKMPGSVEAIVGEAADGALLEAGERLSEYYRGAISEHGLIDTGELMESIGPTTVRVSAKEGRHLDVYPQGTRKNGTRNAAVGFYHEYGVKRSSPRKSVNATHWMSNALDDVEEEINEILKRGVAEAMENALLGTIDENIGG